MSDANAVDGAHFISAAEATERAALSADYLTKLCRQGKIRGKQIGRHWVIESASLDRFLIEHDESKRQRSAQLSAELRRVAEQSGKRNRIGAAYPTHARTPASLLPPELVDRREPRHIFKKLAAASLALALTLGAATAVSANARAAVAQTLDRLSAIASVIAGNAPGVYVPTQFGEPPAAVAAAITAYQNSNTASLATSSIPNVPQTPPATSIAVRSSYATSQSNKYAPTLASLPVASAAFDANAFVTQDQLDNSVSALGSSLRELIAQNYQQPLVSGPEAPLAVENFAPSQQIDQLSGTTLSNVSVNGISGLTASEIPDLSGVYLPLSGGTLSGALNVSDISASSTTFTDLFSTNASTTNATSTEFYTSGLTVSATSTLAGLAFSSTNCSSYGNGGKLTTDAFGNVVCAADQGGAGSTVGGADTQVQFNSAGSFTGASSFTFASSTNLLTVANASTTNLSASYASTTRLVAGNATTTNLYVSGAATLANPLSIQSGGTGTTTAPSYGQLLVGNTSGGFDLLATSSLGISGGGGGSGTVTSVTAGTGLTGGTITTSGTLSLNTANANIWSALQIFTGNASSSNFSNFGTAYFGATATTTIDSAGNLSVAGNTTLQNATTTSLFVKSTLAASAASFGSTATSSFNSTGQLTLANLASAVLGVNAFGQVVATTTIGTNLLAGVLGTINGTSLSAGGSITVASTTLLADNNTFGGIDNFTNASGNFAGTWQTFSPSHFQTAGTYLTGLGNYATTTGTAISISTSTATINGQTLGLTAAVSASGILLTPTISGTLNNSGLTSSTIGATSPNSTLSIGSAASLGSTFTADLNLAHGNSWTGLQQFANASTSLFSAYGPAYFGATATSSFNSAGQLTLAGLTNALLYANGSNQVAAVSVSSPLSFSSGTLSIPAASGTQNGYLASGDWSTFNNKISSSSLSASFPLAYNASSGAFTFNGLSTSTNPTVGQLSYWTGANTFGTVATSAATCSSGVSCSGFTVLGGVSPSITNTGVLSLAQTYGSAQTGALTLSTSTLSFNGLTAGNTITNSGGTFTIAPTLSGTLSNAGLAHSTIVVNSTTLTLGDSGDTITAASSTLLTDNNTFSGIDNFTNASSNFAGTWQTFSPSHFQTAGTYLTGIGNYATTTATAISISTSTVLWNGLTLGNTFTVSSNGITVTPTVSGTISNSGLTNSTIGATSPNSTLSIGAAASLGSTFTADLNLAHANSWTGLQQFANASTSLFSAYGPAYFGGTATSSFNNAGALALASALTVGNGGTGATSLTGVLQGNGSGAITGTPGTAGQFPYYSGASTLAATSSLFLGTAGQIGIGTTTPDTNFSIYAASKPSLEFSLGAGSGAQWTEGINTANGNSFEIASSSALGTNARFVINGAGYVGIGTTSPASIFAVQGVANWTTATSTFYSSGGINLTGGGCFSINGTCVGGGSSLTGSTGQLAYFSGTNSAAGTSTLFLTSAGLFGIGTSSPLANESIQATAGQTPFIIASSTGATLLSVSQSGALNAQLAQLTSTYTVNASSSNISVGDIVSYINGQAQKANTTGTSTTISVGTPAALDSTSDSFESAAALSSTSFVVVYQNTNIYGVVCVASGPIITCGSPVLLDANSNFSAGLHTRSVAALSSTSFVVTYQNPNTTDANAVVATVSGTTITAGTPVDLTFSNNDDTYESAAALSSTSFVVTYDNGDTISHAVVATVSGTTITAGTPATLDSNGATYGSVAALSSTSFVLAYVNNVNHTSAVVATVSGTTITAGTPVALDSTTDEYGSVAALSSTSFVVAYLKATGGAAAYAVVSTVSGTTITAGTPAALNSGSDSFESAAALSPTSFVVTYDATGAVLNALVSTVSGTTITAGTPATLDSNTGSYPSTVILSPSNVVVAYESNATAHTKAVLAQLQSVPGVLGMVTVATSTNSNMVTVASNGIVTGLSGLTAGSTYYWSPVYGLTTVGGGYEVGLALSSTSMLLNSNNAAQSNQFFGDAIFANDFRITEAPGSPQGLIFENQLDRQIASLDEDGNWAVQGTLTSQGIASTTLQQLLATSTATQTGYDFVGDLMDTIAARLSTLNLFTTATSTAATSTAATSSPQSATSTPLDQFASDFLQSLLGQITQWLANAQNGIGDLFANRIIANEVCANTSAGAPVCVTGDQLAALLSAAGTSQSPESVSSSNPQNSSSPSPISVSSTTTPIIQVNGDNPAIIQIGNTYTDLGATITGPQQDLNLGIQTFVNGAPMSPVQIDTSQAATDTVQYVAIDQSGVTATSTRTVIIEPAQAPSIVPNDDASSTATTTTS